MKGHMKKKAGGGKIDGGLGTKEEDHEIEEKKRGGKAEKKKHGGKVEKKKHGGKVEGKKAHMRADKRARGGAINKDMTTKSVKSAGGMTPTSPLSGAGATKEPKTPKNDKEDD